MMSVVGDGTARPASAARAAAVPPIDNSATPAANSERLPKFARSSVAEHGASVIALEFVRVFHRRGAASEDKLDKGDLCTMLAGSIASRGRCLLLERDNSAMGMLSYAAAARWGLATEGWPFGTAKRSDSSCRKCVTSALPFSLTPSTISVV